MALRFGLGSRLLLFSAVLLALPWLGYSYLESMKAFLLKGQEDAQLLAARAVSTVLQDRSDLFDPSDDVPGSMVEKSALFVYPLDAGLQVDGFSGDWDELIERSKGYASPDGSLAYELLMGEFGDYLYVWLGVADDQVVYRHPRYRRLNNSDHVRLSFRDGDGRLRRLVLITEAPGSVSVYEVEANWKYPLDGEPLRAVHAVWQATVRGFNLELRMPVAWLGEQRRLMITVADVDDAAARHVERLVSTLPQEWSDRLNRLIIRSPELERILGGLEQSETRICVVDRYRRVRAVLGGQDIDSRVCQSTDRISNDSVREALAGKSGVRRYRSDGGQTMIMASMPVYAGDEVIGAVLLERNSARILGQQRDTLNQVIFSTFVVLLVVVAGLLLFGAWLTLRIRRLQAETAAAIDADGRVVKTVIETGASADDELGELSRGIADLLVRLQGYTGFLESVPRTLRHEILNPVNTISMSLQRLQEAEREERDGAIRSARQATRQLQQIVNGLTEAAHIEEALRSDDSEVLDLAALLCEYSANLERLHPDRSIRYHGPDSGIRIRGNALRLVQLLDKLKDNALDFTPPDGRIVFELRQRDGAAELSLSNDGPAIPDDVRQQLFAGMISHRPGTGGAPHLGIGLFVARQIALHHGADLEVDNCEDGAGVRVRLRIPIAG